MCKIHQTDDPLVADAEHLRKQKIGVHDSLKRTAQNHIIITVVHELRQSAVQIRLDHGDAAADTLNDLSLIQLHSHDLCILEHFQCLEETPGAASEVKNLRSVGNHIRNRGKIRTRNQTVIIHFDCISHRQSSM